MTARERMLRVSNDLRHPPISDMGQDAAFPETEFAERWDDPVAVGLRVLDSVPVETPELREEAGCDRGRPDCRSPDLDEVTPVVRHAHLQLRPPNWFLGLPLKNWANGRTSAISLGERCFLAR